MSELSKRHVAALKAGKDYAITYYARRAASLARQAQFPSFFGGHVTLVPVCRSSPVVRGGLWVPLLLAQTLHQLGMAREVTPLLIRTSAVAKSAFARPADRPTLRQHFDSMRVETLQPPPTHIVLVDDVVTRGTTLLAAASLIALAYPHAEVRAFASVRTMSLQEITDTKDPCVGLIEPRGRWSRRDP